jgi:hypothetical protein
MNMKQQYMTAVNAQNISSTCCRISTRQQQQQQQIIFAKANHPEPPVRV